MIDSNSLICVGKKMPQEEDKRKEKNPTHYTSQPDILQYHASCLRILMLLHQATSHSSDSGS